MMPGHGQIQLPLIKKIKIGRPEHSLTPPPPTPLRPITSHFCLKPPSPSPHPQGGRRMCITPNSVLNKGKSAIPPLFNGLAVLSSTSYKAKMFAKNMNLKEPCFPDCWKVSSVVPDLRMFGKALQLKTTALVVFFL